MTTAIRVRLCSHLQSGEQRSYVEIKADQRECLDCAALRYSVLDDRRFYGVYLQVTEAREQRVKRA